jgi:hypothetical protein
MDAISWRRLTSIVKSEPPMSEQEAALAIDDYTSGQTGTAENPVGSGGTMGE